MNHMHYTMKLFILSFCMTMVNAKSISRKIKHTKEWQKSQIDQQAKPEIQYKHETHGRYIDGESTVLRRDAADNDLTLRSYTGREAEYIADTAVATKAQITEDIFDIKKKDMQKQESAIKEIVQDVTKIKNSVVESIQQAVTHTEEYLQKQDEQESQQPEKRGKEKIVDSNATDLPVHHRQVIDNSDSDSTDAGVVQVSVLEHLQQNDMILNLKKVDGRVQFTENKKDQAKKTKGAATTADHLKDAKQKTRAKLDSYKVYSARNKLKDFFTTRVYALNSCLHDVYEYAQLQSLNGNVDEIVLDKMPEALRARMSRAVIKCNQQFDHKCFYKTSDEAIEHVLRNFKDKKKCPQVDRKGMESDGIIIIRE